MNPLEYGSIQVTSPKLSLILQEISQISLQKENVLNFIIVGEPGTGKTTMAQHIKNIFFKTEDILIQKNMTCLTDFKHDEKAIYTLSLQHWIQFRDQLLNRNTRIIQMPTLHERKSDLVALANFFLQVLSLMKGYALYKLSDKAAEMISHYTWPGQFYEFESVLEKAIEKAHQEASYFLIEAQHLNLNSLPTQLEFSVGMRLEEIERKFILQTLYFVHQNRTKAAEILGISIRTLRNKINQYREEGFL